MTNNKGFTIQDYLRGYIAGAGHAANYIAGNDEDRSYIQERVTFAEELLGVLPQPEPDLSDLSTAELERRLETIQKEREALDYRTLFPTEEERRQRTGQ